MRIPRIIHQTWKTAELPADLAALQATWQALHPHWQYRLWTDSDNRALIAEHEPWFLPIYDGYQQPICRVDAARYFILKHHGGVYIDLDFECVRPLDAALEGHGMVIGLEPQAHTELEHIRSHGVDVLLCPSFIACTPDHPFWAQVEKGLVQYHQASDPLEATGPLLLSRLYQRLSNKSAVHLLPAEMLYPISKFDCWDRLLNDPGFKAKVIAAPEVLGIHHWHLQLPALGIQIPDSPIEAAPLPSILILTPLKNARAYLPRYVEKLLSLDYPSDRLSLALLESDSSDGSFEWLQQQRATLEKRFRKVQLIKRDFGFQLNDVRWARALQRQRRSVLAKSRNALLQAALGDEQFVLWLDIDVSDYPANVFQQLLATGKEIVLPHCVDGSGMTFDLNTFCFKDPAKGDSASALCDGLYQPSVGEGRWYLQDMREPLVKVDAVGGTMLLVNADLHRDGLNFPSFPYRHYIETEGLAMMAKDMGYSCWALRTLEIVHPRVA